MRDHPRRAAPAPLLLQRRAILIACGVAVLLTLVAIGGGAIEQVLLALAIEGAFLVAWLAAAAGIGSVFVRVRGSGAGALNLVTAIAMGLGILGLAALGLGLAGWLNRPLALGLIALGIVAGIIRLQRAALTMPNAREWLAARSPWSWLWLAAAPVIGIVVLAALAPPGILWGDEPHAYDVLEYHLQIPREWYEAGRIHRLDHNAFSYFPQGVETHYLLAMHLRGGPWRGMYLAQLMHAAMTLLSAAAVFAVARALTMATRPATIAAVAALTVPWIALLAPMGYNEGGMLLYGALAIGWTLHALRRHPRGDDATGADHADLTAGRRWGDTVRAGIFAGFACGAKLTAGPLLLLGLPIAAVASGLDWKRAAATVVVGVAVFSPWAARTFAWSGGNPVFPEANAIFPSDRFTPSQEERWRRAHAPPPGQRSIVARLRAAGAQIVFDWRYGYVLLPMGTAAAAVAARRHRPEARLLAVMLAVIAIFWIGFTHLQGRFFVLAIPVGALLLAQLERPAHLAVAAAAVVAQALLTIGLLASHPRLQLARDAGAFGIEQMELLLPPEMQEAVKTGAPVELVGDAQAFRYPIPMSRLRYRTVFDVESSAAQAAGAEDIVSPWLGSPRRPGAYIFLDPDEILRLSKTYYDVAPPPFTSPNAAVGGGGGGGPIVIPP